MPETYSIYDSNTRLRLYNYTIDINVSIWLFKKSYTETTHVEYESGKTCYPLIASDIQYLTPSIS